MKTGGRMMANRDYWLWFSLEDQDNPRILERDVLSEKDLLYALRRLLLELDVRVSELEASHDRARDSRD